MTTQTELLVNITDTDPNREMGSLTKLKDSLNEVGLINPLTIDTEGRLLAGRRRYHAMIELGWEQCAVHVLDPKDDIEVKIICLHENLRRKPLTDPENRRMIAEIDELMRNKYGSVKERERTDLTASDSEADKKWGSKQTATKLGISEGAVSEAKTAENFVKDNPELDNLSTPMILEVKKTPEEFSKKVKDEIIQRTQEAKPTTINDVKRIIRETTKPDPTPLPEGIFDIIYGDPPWRYDFSETNSRAIETQYSTMTVEEIKALNIPSADDSVLFLWATAPKLREALEVMKAWGFEYKTHAVWDKEIIGMGYWFRGQHEILMIGTKGTFSPPKTKNRVSSVIRQRRGLHSEKPKQFYNLIEQMCPDGKYLELFARGQRDGWVMWGNEI